ncbi:MAG: hypothetical protein FIB01_07490, partial [Gemmatimonadetes bacterium]|nr:hypothetical protein [Gemmatimonadota bacterium]
PGAWVLGQRPGTNTLEATSAGVAAAAVSVTASAGPPAALKANGAGGRGVVGQAFEPLPGVVVQDAFGNPVAGVAVGFAPGPDCGEVAQSSASTDAEGVARVRWTLGPRPGTQTLLVVLGSLNLTLTAEASAGAPASLQVLTGDGQSATVAQAVAIPPAVVVRDAFGNAVAGATVQFSVTEGSGQVTGASVLSDAGGTARVGGWTLGTRVGSNRLTASVTGALPAVFSATGTPGPAAALARDAGAGQTGGAGQLLAVAPAVLVSDGYGNPVPNAEVTFSAASGTVTGAVARSDALGVARVGGWRLGLLAGTQTLEARAGSLLVTFGATATPGGPAVLEIVAGQGQAAVAGTPVPVRPAVLVRDAGGNVVAGAAVRFTATVGNGTVNGGTVVSGLDGVATVGGWTLGPLAGGNRLVASITGVTSAIFNATGLTGPAARIVKVAGDLQIVTAGTAVPVRPTVRVTDLHGNPVGGITVNFEPSPGSSITGATQTTAASGTASVDRWVLADTAGVNTLVATAPGIGSVTFRSTGVEYAPPPPAFDIEIQFLTETTPVQRQAFESAAARWEGIITADVADLLLDAPASSCGTGSPAFNRIIDDLVILVWLEPIDGVGSVLGSAGPCYVRDSGGLPVLGRMRFDTADLDALEVSGRLADVILHEMGHVLGIGTSWSSFGLLVGAGTDDPIFTGAGARSRFVLAGGGTPAGVPVENTGGGGTRDLHWRESVFGTELMTGWISAAGTPNPLSAITIASLADLGYTVDLSRADPYWISGAQGYQLEAAPGLELVEEKLPPPRVAR